MVTLFTLQEWLSYFVWNVLAGLAIIGIANLFRWMFEKEL